VLLFASIAGYEVSTELFTADCTAMPAAHSSSPQQHQAASLDQDSAAGPEGPSVDSWSEKDQRIVVSQPASGFLYDLILRAKVCGLQVCGARLQHSHVSGIVKWLACMRGNSPYTLASKGLCISYLHLSVVIDDSLQELGCSIK
jgi:hypothetical protein